MPSSSSLQSVGVIFLVIVLSVIPVGAEPSAHPRIRTSDPSVRRALDAGYASSATFRQLVDTVEASSLIVYVERRFLGGRRIAGATRFMGAGGKVRYLHVVMESTLIGDQAAALLGHELQHVVEVVRAPWVVDRRGFAALYRAIGHDCDGDGDRYDTTDAVQAGRRVWQELADRGSR